MRSLILQEKMDLTVTDSSDDMNPESTAENSPAAPLQPGAQPPQAPQAAPESVLVPPNPQEAPNTGPENADEDGQYYTYTYNPDGTIATETLHQEAFFGLFSYEVLTVAYSYDDMDGNGTQELAGSEMTSPGSDPSEMGTVITYDYTDGVFDGTAHMTVEHPDFSETMEYDFSVSGVPQ